MRLLYVVVALVSAFTGYVALEAKPIETKKLDEGSKPEDASTAIRFSPGSVLRT